MCYIRAYLRASTNEQDANRAREQLKAFAVERGLQVLALDPEPFDQLPPEPLQVVRVEGHCPAGLGEKDTVSDP